MVVSKESIKKKLLKEFSKDVKHYCTICRKSITKNDIEDFNFEYTKSKIGENYSHTKCIKLRGRKV